MHVACGCGCEDVDGGWREERQESTGRSGAARRTSGARAFGRRCGCRCAAARVWPARAVAWPWRWPCLAAGCASRLRMRALRCVARGVASALRCPHAGWRAASSMPWWVAGAVRRRVVRARRESRRGVRGVRGVRARALRGGVWRGGQTCGTHLTLAGIWFVSSLVSSFFHAELFGAVALSTCGRAKVLQARLCALFSPRGPAVVSERRRICIILQVFPRFPPRADLYRSARPRRRALRPYIHTIYT